MMNIRTGKIIALIEVQTRIQEYMEEYDVDWVNTKLEIDEGLTIDQVEILVNSIKEEYLQRLFDSLQEDIEKIRSGNS